MRHAWNTGVPGEDAATVAYMRSHIYANYAYHATICTVGGKAPINDPCNEARANIGLREASSLSLSAVSGMWPQRQYWSTTTCSSRCTYRMQLSSRRLARNGFAAARLRLITTMYVVSHPIKIRLPLRAVGAYLRCARHGAIFEAHGHCSLKCRNNSFLH